MRHLIQTSFQDVKRTGEKMSGLCFQESLGKVRLPYPKHAIQGWKGLMITETPNGYFLEELFEVQGYKGYRAGGLNRNRALPKELLPVFMTEFEEMNLGIPVSIECKKCWGHTDYYTPKCKWCEEVNKTN